MLQLTHQGLALGLRHRFAFVLQALLELLELVPKALSFTLLIADLSFKTTQ
ncbi:hypothetical protein HSBAA_07460 [Vreelandella sulfidaeris]|uniref:Uncharacterized protein n=1 Tax=Vreelandella sulfidaeris TaxID=115553 RepID=A0A455U0I6_9GAMM|nr:hypothetical protein HSBAA_07460 [Halomonas sulfidaeris]